MTFLNNVIKDNKLNQLENFSGSKCSVVVDGESVAGPSIDPQIEKAVLDEFATSAAASGGVSSVAYTRSRQRAGVATSTLLCAACGQAEDPSVKQFQKCSRCQNVVYCSKDCQVTSTPHSSVHLQLY